MKTEAVTAKSPDKRSNEAEFMSGEILPKARWLLYRIADRWARVSGHLKQSETKVRTEVTPGAIQ